MIGMGRGSISPEELLGDGTLAAVGGAELPCLQHLAAWQHEDEAIISLADRMNIL